MRIAWATDIHLNFVDEDSRHRFLLSIDRDVDAVAISGDIGESNSVEQYLREIESAIRRPVYFVLGNHDFYRGSIAATREAVARLAKGSEHLVYLTSSPVVELTANTALVGHDGWADARLGDFDSSDIVLNDYVLIAELRNWERGLVLDKTRLAESLNRLGDEAADHVEHQLGRAAARYANAIVLTHVPPFREATWHHGTTSDDNWLPHFSCRAVGEALLRTARSYPSCNLLVLCGHTHGRGEAQLADNLRVLTGGAEYGSPAIQQVFEVT